MNNNKSIEDFYWKICEPKEEFSMRIVTPKFSNTTRHAASSNGFERRSACQGQLSLQRVWNVSPQISYDSDDWFRLYVAWPERNSSKQL